MRCLCTTSRRRTFFVLTALRNSASSRASSGLPGGTVALQATQYDKHAQQPIQRLAPPSDLQVTSSRSSRGPEVDSLRSSPAPPLAPLKSVSSASQHSGIALLLHLPAHGGRSATGPAARPHA
jgi:hypothetical protein